MDKTMPTYTPMRPKPMAELLSGMKGLLTNDTIQMLTSKKKTPKTHQTLTNVKNYKPMTIAELSAVLQPTPRQQPKTTKLKPWNSSVKVDKTRSLTRDGQMKHSTARKGLNFQSNPNPAENNRKTMIAAVTRKSIHPQARKWNPEAAEKMLRDSIKWREKWGVDTTLASWQAPEVLETHFPSGTTGFDKEGSPVLIVPFVGLDVWGLLHSVTRTDIVRMVLRHLENYLALARKQAQTHGPNALKVTVIFDLEGFNIRQYAWKPAAELVFTLLQIYEANYPEILKICFIINAPKVFSLAFNVIKRFMDDYTLSKIGIYGSDAKKWQAQVLAVVDKEQLPQHYGGSMVDENGDPRCSSLVKPGGKVPKKYYSRNITNDSKKEYTKVTVKTGEKHSVDLLCADGDSVLKWEFGVDSHDIKFAIKRRDQEGNETIVHGPRKVTEGPVDVGVLSVSGPATYSIIFDNKSSFWRNKKVYYDVLITVPERDLNMSDDPEDCASTVAAAS